MADIALALSAAVEIDGSTFGLDVEETLTLTAPEKAFQDIVVTSTTITDIGIGSTLTWATTYLLGLKNLSTTDGENIGIYKNGELMALLEPGQSIWIRTARDATAYRWDAVTGTPRLFVCAFGTYTD